MRLFSAILSLSCLLLVACKSTDSSNGDLIYHASDVEVKPTYDFTSSVFPINKLLKYNDGYATFSFTIDTQGKARNIKLITAEPSDIFVEDAISSLRMWKYNPAQRNGIKVPVNWVETIYYGNKYQNTINDYLLRNLSGEWIENETESCSAEFHSISFNNNIMSIEYSDLGYFDESEGQKILDYKIIEFLPYFIRVQLIGETRKDKNGESVIWHIGLRNDGNYCWSRDDWPKNSCTSPRLKCNK